ncbi:MAG: molecular chaperone DnaK [Myxococcales bacterium]|nr:molecular chaperone DnaK [Myxococcales bacterium]
MAEPIIGIDLGTTNSCVAIVEDGVPKVIPNRAGYQTTPSIVAVAESGRRLIGHIAKRQMITNPEGTVYASKRLIGRKWNSPVVQAALETCTFRLIEGPHQDVRILLRETVYSLPEISSIVLGEMKLIAEQYLEREVAKCVITVPAYFNDGQRQATKDAGRIAGLDVVRIINEPTAAALAYGFGRNMERRVAVFDLGGGTFDISILEIGNGVFEVMATAGDTFLGGEDFDNRIIEWLVFGFLKEHGIDLRKDRMALQRIRDASEKAKIELSSLAKTEISLPFIISTGQNEALHLQRTLTREKFEDLVIDLCERCIQICDKTLKDAGIQKNELDDVILVGGQTRTPKIQEMVKEFFGLAPARSVNPDEVVALGASIQGAGLVDERTSVLLLDVTPHDLGIMIVGGFFQKIIEKNTTVPTSAGHVFTTVRDNQDKVRIMVFQGESQRAEDNELLGEFILEGLRKRPRGEVEIEVIFEISADGIVSVSAIDKETHQQQSITVTATSGLTEEEIRKMKQEAQDYALGVKQSDAYEKAKAEVDALLRDVDGVMAKVREFMEKSDFGQEALSKVDATIARAREGFDNRNLDTLNNVKAPLERTLRMLRGVAEKLDSERGGSGSRDAETLHREANQLLAEKGDRLHREAFQRHNRVLKRMKEAIDSKDNQAMTRLRSELEASVRELRDL